MMHRVNPLLKITLLVLAAIFITSSPADAQLKIKFAPDSKGLLFETQVYGIEVPNVPIKFEAEEVLFTKDINNSQMKPSIKYIADGVDIQAIEFGIIVFNYFHEFVMAFPAVEAEPIMAGNHGKWVNIRPGGEFVPFSFEYFVYVRKLRFSDGTVKYYDQADKYAFEQIMQTFNNDVWILDHQRKFQLSDVVYYNTKDYGLVIQDYQMRFDR